MHLDGEVPVFDKELISRFEWLRAQPKDEPATLPVYIAFDILDLPRRDLPGRPLRRKTPSCS
jgi:ATP-dependent DNA ligase